MDILWAWTGFLLLELLCVAGLIWLLLKLNFFIRTVQGFIQTPWKNNLQQVHTQLITLNHQLHQADHGLKAFPWILTASWKGPLLQLILKEGSKQLRRHF